MLKTFQLPRRQVLSGTMGLGAAALAAPRIAKAQDKKVVRIRYKADIKVVEPAGNFVVDEQFIVYGTQSNLITWAPGDKWVWQLDAASSIEQVDETHVAFTLRPGIMFSNGYGEMTAEDVKYSFERMMNPDLNATDRQEFEQFDHVEVTDSRSGVIVTKGPVATMWTGILPRYFCAIVSKKAWEEIDATTRTLSPNEVPCFGGPYVLQEWVPGQKIVLARNDVWNGEPVYYDEVEYILIPDDKAAELAYEAGEVDITQISIGSAKTFRDNPLPDTDLYIRPTTGFVWLGINVQHTPYEDVRVREALRKAIDVDQIIEAAYFGVPSPSTGIISPGLMGWRDAAIEPRDVEGAKALLAEAGLADGFTTHLAVLNQTEDLAAAQVIQANLADIGVDLQIDSFESGAYWSLGLESDGEMWKDLELVYQDWTSGADPRRATMWFVSDQIGEWNWQRWSNAEYDALDAAAAVETDPAKRTEMYQRMMEIQYEEAAFINITHRPWVTLVRSNIDPEMMANGYVYPRYVRAKEA